MELSGKTFFVWQIKNALGGNAGALLARLKADGCNRVVVKALDGPVKYNLRQANGMWVDDILPTWVKTLQAGGIEVWIYQYVYHLQPAREAEAFLDRAEQLHISGLVIDAEGEVEYHVQGAQAATEYMKLLRAGTTLPIALCSFRFPKLHLAFPWKAYMDGGVNFHMPQVYWVGAHNAAEQLQRSVTELSAIKALPIVPVGPAYSESGWSPIVADMIAFDQAAHALNLPGVAWWAWDDNGIEKFPAFEQTLASTNWPIATTPKEYTTEQKIDIMWTAFLAEHPETA